VLQCAILDFGRAPDLVQRHCYPVYAYCLVSASQEDLAWFIASDRLAVYHCSRFDRRYLFSEELHVTMYEIRYHIRTQLRA